LIKNIKLEIFISVSVTFYQNCAIFSDVIFICCHC